MYDVDESPRDLNNGINLQRARFYCRLFSVIRFFSVCAANFNLIYKGPAPTVELVYPTGRRTDGKIYRVFIKYCVFSLKFWIFLNSASSAAIAGLLPALCVYTRHRGRTEKGQSPEYFKISGKKHNI